MANFLNYIVESSIQPVKTNVLWIKNGVPYYFNKKWKPLLGSGSGGGSGESVDSPIQFGEGEYSAVLKNSNSKALNDYALALGYNTVSNNSSEAAFGKFNKSVLSSDFSKATLFSIGNGTTNLLKNAFEVKFDGSIYIEGIDITLQKYLENLTNEDLQFYSEITRIDNELKAIRDSIDIAVGEGFSEFIKQFESSIKRIEALEDKTVENSTKITQNAEQIQSITTRVTVTEETLTQQESRITQTAEQIRLEVSEEVKTLDGKIEENTSSITQTANEIRLEVESVTTNLDNKIEKNTSAITQTAEQIRSEVNKSIEEVNGNISDVSSSLTQTAEAIRSEVAKEVETLSGEIEKNTTSITQNANSINLRVESLENTLNSKTSELEGKITKNTSEIALNKEQIGLKVNTDVFDELAGTVEQQGASIEINTNSIKNKVEQSSFNAFTGEVNNQFTEVNQSIEGITTTVQDNTGKITVIEETVDGLTSKTGTLEAEIESLKKQSDGSIDTHFGTTAPTLNNEPAVNWDTDELKNEHTGDIYYNNNTGEAYRFSYDPQTNTYFWVELTDSALTDALEKISKLEEAIDGKVTIFYTQPSNYKYGDIWFVHNNSYSPYKEGSLLTATNLAKDAVVESFNLNHWVLKADIVKSLNDLDKTVTDAFKDNIITIAEVDAIKESKKAFESSFQELTSAHAIVIATTLGNTTKLKTAYSNLESKYNVFIQSIDSLVLDSNGNLSDILLQAYTTAYNDYVEALKNYSKAKEELTDNIQKELSSANDYIKDISSDGVITPIEKKNLIEIWRSIAEEFNTNKGIAVNYKIIDSEGNERTDIYSDGVYYSNYALYEAAFDEIKTIFISDVFGISNITTSTTLPEGYSTNIIDNVLNNYYDTLSVFAEMISKITIEITDAHEKVLQLSKELQEQLSPSDNITQIGKGVILSSIIGVQSNGVLQAGLNATNINGLVDTSKDKHGRIVFAGGINGTTDWNTAKTVIYEDGYVHFRWGEIDEGVEIGNALIRSVVSGTIDLFSYPENGTLVPLFIVNKDNTGKIVSISTPYDFIANKNLIVHGDTSSGGEGGEATIGVTGIIVDGKQFTDKNSDGYIDLSEAFVGLSPTITSTMITEALGYTPLSKSGGTITGDLNISGILDWARYISTRGHYFFVRDDDDANWCVTNRNWTAEYTLLHSGNVGDYALPKAGGTITSTSHNVLRINSSYSEGGVAFSRLYIAHSDADKAFVGWDSENGTILYNNSGKYLGIKDDGTPYYYSGGGVFNTLYHTGNFNPANYLPLTGGTISSGYANSLILKITNGKAVYLTFSQEGEDKAYVGYNADLGTFLQGPSGSLILTSSGATLYNNTLLHAGNYSNYALPLTGGLMKDASTIQWGNNLCSWDDVQNGLIGMSTFKEDAAYGYYAGLSFKGYYGLQLRSFGGNSSSLEFRGFNGANWSVWKTIAFTDSTVDKARKLVTEYNTAYAEFTNGTVYIGGETYSTSNTVIMGNAINLRYGSGTNGLILNSAGNVAIGSSDYAGAKYKLYVDYGKSHFAAWNSSEMTLGSAQPNSVLIGDVNNGLGIWYQYPVGSVIQAEMFNGEARAENLIIQPLGGNVGIGTTDPKYKLDVNGDVRINGNLIVTGDTASGGGSGESAIGITGILLNGTTYRDENGDGIIDLGTITSGLTSVNWSDVQGRPTSLSQFNNDLGLGTLAYKNGLTASDVGALSTSGGTINSNTYDILVLDTSYAYGDARIHLKVNGESKSLFGWSSALGTMIYNATNGYALGIKDDGTPHYNGSTLYHTGNFNPADYLPLSGGTIDSGSNDVPLVLKSSGTTTWLRFTSSDGTARYLGVGNGNTLKYQFGGLSYNILTSAGGTINGSLTLNEGVLYFISSGKQYAYNVNTGNGEPIYLKNDAWQTLLHSGNYSDYALPLSGGTLMGDLNVAGDIVTKSFWTGTDGAGLYIEGKSNVGIRIQYNKSETGHDYDQLILKNGVISWNNNTILHSGNIGDYAATRKSRQSTIDLNTASNGFYEVGYSGQEISNRPSGTNNGLFMDFRDANGYAKIQFYGNNVTNGLYFRTEQGAASSVGSAWKTIAFTDSNITGYAAGLIHSNGQVGATVGETGNLSINKRISSADDSLNLFEYSAGFLYLGYSLRNEYTTRVYGNKIEFLTGDTQRMLINSSGNVTIGNADYAGTNYRLWVEGTTYHSSELYLANWAYLASYKTDGSRVLMVGLDNNNLLTINQSGSGVNTVILGGNVGIGTTEPYCQFEVASTYKDINPTSIAASAIFAVNRHKDDGLFIGHDYTKKGSWIQSSYYGTEALPSNTHTYKLFLQPIGGNVLIGTTTDSGYKLDVNGSAAFGSTSDCHIVLRRSGGLNYIDAAGSLRLTVNGGSNALTINTDMSTYMYGAVTMDSTLSVAGAITLGFDNAIKGGNGTDLMYQMASGALMLGYGVASKGCATYLNGNEVRLRYGTSMNDGLILKSTGNVGIGTTNPQAKLDVAGDLHVSQLIKMTKGTSSISVLGFSGDQLCLGYSDVSTYDTAITGRNILINPVAGVANVLGALEVNGAVSMASTLNVGGNTTINGDVRINGNLIVTGDTASGGSAGTTTGGVSILTINGNIPVGSSISQSQLDAIGFTSEVLTDLMNGKYVYVKNIRSNGSFSLMALSANGSTIYMKEGSENFEMIEYVFFKSSSTTWRIEVYEV